MLFSNVLSPKFPELFLLKKCVLGFLSKLPNHVSTSTICYFLNFHLFMVIYHLPSIVDYTRFFLNFHLFMVIYHIPSIVDYTSFMRKVSVVVLCHSVAVV